MAHRNALQGLLHTRFKRYDAAPGHQVGRISRLSNFGVGIGRMGEDPRQTEFSKKTVLEDQKPAKKEAGTSKATTIKEFKIYRWSPDKGGKPNLQSYFVDISRCGPMAELPRRDLWVLNIDGTNTVTCLCSVKMDPKHVTTITPLPHMYVIKDVVVDMTQFYQQYNTACPSYWWNQEQFLDPAALLAANRWIMDSRDDYTLERIDYLDHEYKLGRRHTSMNCARTWPKSLNPGKAIAQIRSMQVTKFFSDRADMM